MSAIIRAPDQWSKRRMEEIVDHLFHKRKIVLKMSRRELAARSGVTASTIQKIEEGKVPNPGLFTIAAMAIQLDVDLSESLRSYTGPLSAHRRS